MSHYDTDILQWSERQAALLRRRAAGELINDVELDWPNIAEEIESVGRSERRELAKQVRTIIEHLAKLELSPATEPLRGWQETILRTRTDISDLIKSSPSLGPTLDAVVSDEMAAGLELAVVAMTTYGETPRRPVEDIFYTLEQVRGPWLP